MEPRQIQKDLHRVFTDLYRSLESYSDSDFLSKKDESTWSLGQMYEHISSASKKFFLANVQRCIDQRKGQEGGEMTEYGIGMYKLGSFPDMKIKIPKVFGEPEIIPQAKEQYKTEIKEILQGVDAITAQVELASDTYKVGHPVLGYLNAKEWFQNLEMHTRHHLKQKAELESYL